MHLEHPRHIRSFHPRRSRVTAGQQRALDAGWPHWGVEGDGPLDVAGLFGRTAPLVLEIGFGMGETTARMAAADPARDVLAVDVHTPGVGALLGEVAALGLGNVRVVVGDAVEVLRDRLGPGSLDEVRAYFPDPWPKARHHKRRLVSPDFLALAADRVRAGGRLHLATDWADYAGQMSALLHASPAWTVEHEGARPDWRPVTRFEQQGLAKGHAVVDLIARRG
ncbi:tRNA (guanine-N(7)-)-methyltransferase [Motilibacter rhizosphaerae]|uniref:tRNA (guanine-N(7)-)-methyltransferase n=1 Tax=Motilibacter rhizosphaerae TaxID=598652 RepID=A0A4V2F4B3_9ACTN|nr:tRNA (guanosine(46)-N7)-methyltransferase TrmB [Motilibacter rhizosphaerae]RZS87007.1 tRNA (guanine-N(7)-)-methyltransferase [Motilibacter rhizosphaerae]